MSSRITSFVGLFDHRSDDTPRVERIEIPLIQRDYAQGRTDESATRIRERFLEVLRSATTGVESVGLDFIYGDVSDGTLRPLDGQQRLTTLFLLHWYVASRTHQLDGAQRWTEFAYATRPSARRFCEQLVRHPLPNGETPRFWITDQPWYLYVWRLDPSVQSMLEMLDAIHGLCGDDDLDAAWARLLDLDHPAISFHLLPIDDMGSPEDLYIKMNSRGKPLTEFENFKAQLEKALQNSPRVDELAMQIDGRWADVMWHLRGEDDVFDDEFLNYLRFILDVSEWLQGADRTLGDDVGRAVRAFGPTNPLADENLAFLFDAFNVWFDRDTGDVVHTHDLFESLLATPSTPNAIDDEKLVMFGDVASNINLFEACCGTRSFGRGRSLLLYAVHLSRIHATEDFPRRLRVLRNLVEASTNEIRPQAMSKLTADVWRIIVDGELDTVEGFNTEQVSDELLKREFLAQYPDLESEVFRLEDHDLLRGCLMAFDLDPETLAHRAEAFAAAMVESVRLPGLTGALLATGDYSRDLAASKHRLGSSRSMIRWRDLLAGDAPSRSELADTRAALGRLLDEIANSELPVDEQLVALQSDWVRKRDDEQLFDWRYYLVKYPAMREGKSGVYAAPGAELGFSLCMLEGKAMNGYYRDPVLLAIARELNLQESVWGSIEHKPDGPWFTGGASIPRWMRLRESGVQIRCVENGFAVRSPNDPHHLELFERVRLEHGLLEDEDGLQLSVPQQKIGNRPFDTSDRVILGAAFLRDLVAAGL